MPDPRPPVVLIPGLGLDRHVWDGVLAPLSRRFDPTVVELPLVGDTAPAAVAERIAGHLDGRVAGPVHLVGQSFGGTVALHLAHRIPALSVTAFAPAGLWGPAQRTATAATLRASVDLTAALPARLLDRLAATATGRRALLALFCGRPAGVPPRTAAQALHTYAALAADVRRAVADIHRVALPPPPAVPVLVVWGTRDLVIRPPAPHRVRRWAPQARTRLVPGAGHVPMWTHRSEVLAAIGSAVGRPDLAGDVFGVDPIR